MASAVPLWLLGKEITLSVRPISINTTTGVIVTTASSVSFFGILNEGSPFSVQNQVEKVAISPSDNPYRNKVIVEQGSDMTITEIIQAATPTGTADSNTGLAKNAIEFLVTQSFHYDVTAIWKDPAGTTKRTNVGRYQYNGHSETYTKTGQNAMQLALETFSTITSGTYDTNPTLS